MASVASKRGELKEKIITDSIINIKEMFREETINNVIDLLYQDIDILQNKISLIDYNFMSPFSSLGSKFYRYYIKDTIDYKGEKVIKLLFSPIDKQSFSFEGEMYVAYESNHKVMFFDMKTREDINLNFAENLHIMQSFKIKDGVVYKDEEVLEMDIEANKKLPALHIKRNEIFTELTPAEYALTTTENTQKINIQNLRPKELDQEGKGVYKMVDDLNENKWWKSRLAILKVLSTGYHITAKKRLVVGNIFSLLNYNEPEGFKLSGSYKTLPKLHPKINSEGHLSYGFRDKKWKYAFNIGYSFNAPFDEFPEHYFDYSYRRIVRFPGDYFDLSDYEPSYATMRLGDIQNFLFIDDHTISYLKEYKNNFMFKLSLTKGEYSGYGRLNYKIPEYTFGTDTGLFNDFRANLTLVYAPNQKYFRSRMERVQLMTRYPHITLSYDKGFKNVLGSNHDYSSLRMYIVKRINLSFLGYTYSSLKLGYTWGDIPPMFMYTPRANIGFVIPGAPTGIDMFNMHSDMEFIADRYAQLQLTHYFNGFFTFKIPLIEKLNIKEVVTFRSIMGDVSGVQRTKIAKLQGVNSNAFHTLKPTLPYMEASVGIENIFKVLRIDLIRRLNYLDSYSLNTFSSWGPYSIRIRLITTL